MELLEGIKTRRSIRSFEDKMVDNVCIKEIIASAVYAPSWKNSQVVRYRVIKNKSLLEKIAKEGICNFTFNEKTILGCGGLVVVSVVKNRCGYERDGSFSTTKEDRWEMFDSGVASQTFCLAAHEKGIGSVILGIFDEEKIAELVELPENEKVACLIAIGYPKEEPMIPKRKEVEEILHILE